MCLGSNARHLVAHPKEDLLARVHATELLQQSETSAPQVECGSQIAERRQPVQAVAFIDANHGSRILPTLLKSSTGRKRARLSTRLDFGAGCFCSPHLYVSHAAAPVVVVQPSDNRAGTDDA